MFGLTIAPALIRAGLALAVVLAIAAAGWVINGWRTGLAAAEVRVAQVTAERDAQAAARRIQAQAAARQMEIVNAKAAQIRRVDARLADALVSLRDRAPRRDDPASTPSTDCQGGDGRGLAGPDAEFLTRYAAAAARQQAALAECYASLGAPVTPGSQP